MKYWKSIVGLVLFTLTACQYDEPWKDVTKTNHSKSYVRFINSLPSTNGSRLIGRYYNSDFLILDSIAYRQALPSHGTLALTSTDTPSEFGYPQFEMSIVSIANKPDTTGKVVIPLLENQTYTIFLYDSLGKSMILQVREPSDTTIIDTSLAALRMVNLRSSTQAGVNLYVNGTELFSGNLGFSFYSAFTPVQATTVTLEAKDPAGNVLATLNNVDLHQRKFYSAILDNRGLYLISK
ncbi:MAG: DUF4397 domain-containing protein [Bacteroidia bacterium]|nr:DUF4397 domain-containing protein [Bacteroidia bacterium]